MALVPDAVPRAGVVASEPPGGSGDLGGLGDELASTGYGEFVTCFNPFALNPGAWRACRGAAPARLTPVIDLFLLGASVAPATLPSGIRALLPDLTAAGLILEERETVSTGGRVVLLLFGHWLACQPPQADPVHYLGQDSLALLARLAPGGARTCLDLCAGPGIHALHCARFAARVTAVERNPAAARLAACNARLNRVADRVEVLTGDLYEPVAGRRFDLICANPPALPYPADLPGPAIGHGGDDGMHTTWRIVNGLPAALTDRGRAQIVGMTLTDGVASRLAEQLEGVALAQGLTMQCSVLSHTPLVPGSDLFERLVTTVSCIAGTESARVRTSYLRLLARVGATHLCTFFLQIARGAGALELLELSAPGGASRWHV